MTDEIKNDAEEATANPEEQAESTPSFTTFDEFLQAQDDTVRSLYETQTSGLRSALEKERESRKQANETINNLRPLVEKGSATEKQLNETLATMEQLKAQAERDAKRANFAEQAITPDVNCTNIKAAFALATAENLFNEDGVPNWTELKKLAPELFGTKRNHAGATGEPVAQGMNQIIREAAGFK